ncbi:MAG: hypothetical protein MUF23_10825 [Pirellula sp.]|nr:hypothetical protein [Pirellula sp.]
MARTITLDEACSVEKRFMQDAIYQVDGDLNFVVQCHSPEQRFFVDWSSKRIDP